jgi:hypothetical protein
MRLFFRDSVPALYSYNPSIISCNRTGNVGKVLCFKAPYFKPQPETFLRLSDQHVGVIKLSAEVVEGKSSLCLKLFGP